MQNIFTHVDLQIKKAQKTLVSAWVPIPLANHNQIFFSTSICPFESGKCGKEGKSNFEYLEHEKSFFDEIKNIFYSFWWKK